MQKLLKIFKKWKVHSTPPYSLMQTPTTTWNKEPCRNFHTPWRHFLFVLCWKQKWTPTCRSWTVAHWCHPYFLNYLPFFKLLHGVLYGLEIWFCWNYVKEILSFGRKMLIIAGFTTAGTKKGSIFHEKPRSRPYLAILGENIALRVPITPISDMGNPNLRTEF
jgi:hypothetical protein